MDDNLTDTGRAALEAAAARNGFSRDAARAMLDALVAGRGSQAQFGHPELGGMGQWSQGGMLMIGDMFNNGLKARVGALASDLAALATDPSAFAAGPRGRGDWWPEGLGHPSSVGAQNQMRYAVFPEARRLAIDLDGAIALYDTGDHRIGGASQQQGGDQTLSFSSQFGTVTLASLRRVDQAAPSTAATAPGVQASGVVAAPADPAPHVAPAPQVSPAPQAAPAPSVPPAPPVAPAPPVSPAPPVASSAAPHPAASPVAEPPRRAPAAPAPASEPAGAAGDPLALIERLAELHRKGVLTDEEFSAKKKDLLDRL